MQVFWWYGVSAVSIFALIVFKKVKQYLYIAAEKVTTRLAYRVVISRGLWSAISVTVLHIIALLAFIGINILLILLTLDNGLEEITMINLVPLFLGGRTNVVIDYLDISLHIYYFAHRWLGRIVVAQALIHTVTKFSASPSRLVFTTGVIATILLVINILISVLPMRRWAPTWFRWTHLILSLATLGIITLHIFELKRTLLSFTSVLCLVAAGLTMGSWMLLLGRRCYRSTAVVTKYDTVGDRVCLWVRTRYDIRCRPGAYFYLSFPGLPWRYRFQSYLAPLSFWDTESRDSTREISFFVPARLSQAIEFHLQRNRTLQVSLDGYYGERICMGNYELVVLIANGGGIAGVLPFALSALSRRKYDKADKTQGLQNSLYCDKTRKVDLIWQLDDNSQVEGASSYFNSLANMEVHPQGRKVSKVKDLPRILA
ncbi:hypothetical protein VM1G_00669 [Cytospora mali]|uniref:Ferric oxidoreductase domain-containing protein n=1 Tax=Cytospora mali TaxID=578113 RepID=A0A194VMT0_CYTMA|nr:hypothetical protein VM1G_00669 [Valsa mali]